MPGATPIYGWPYPIAADPLDDAVSVTPQALATAIESTLQGFGGIAAPGAWVAPALGAGWANQGAPYQTVKYRKIGSNVIGRGLAATAPGVAAGAAIFTLPVLHRPLATEWSVVMCTGASAGAKQLEIDAAGKVSCATALAAGSFLWVGFSFYVD